MEQRRYRHAVKDNKSLWYRWHGIKKRCLNKHDERYDEYGGRGIKVCDEWLRSFDAFADWAYANGYREDLTIERIDVNGDYCPENCCWIPREEQKFNKRDTIWVNYHGERIQLAKLCQKKGLRYDAIHNRIMKIGMDAETAIDTPLHSNEGSLLGKCKTLGLRYEVVRDRIRKLGWSEEDALRIPTGRGKGAYYSDRKVEENCARCGKAFIKVVAGQKFCCAECREAAKAARKSERSGKRERK